MNPISKFVWNFSANARQKRSEFFRSQFNIDENTRLLDLGSEDGANIFNVIKDTTIRPENVFIADINEESLNEGRKLYGFNKVLIDESERLPFPDGFFDIVYCSSVIEHVTVQKSELWKYKNGSDFKRDSWERQSAFAKEIDRLGKQYFVQTPSKSFPIESHTWLPFIGYLPRRLFLPILKLSNRVWVKAAEPDFNLLGRKEMGMLFPNAKVIEEVKYGLTKSIMVVKIVDEERT